MFSNIKKEKVVEFRNADNGTLFGVYHYDDPFKSFFNGLYTSNGHNVLAQRGDASHPHHKGLQYGLCAEDVNFWEEENDPEQRRRIGRQQTKKLDLLSGSNEIGFSQEIAWQDDLCVSFHETRIISVQKTTTAYIWTWQTTLTAARDLQIIKSAWAQGPSEIGYCGLGLRLAGDLFKKGRLYPDVQAGCKPRSIAYQGTVAEVKFEQDMEMQNVLFVSFYGKEPNFAFMSLGPTNGGARTIKKGECLKGNYIISVSDL